MILLIFFKLLLTITQAPENEEYKKILQNAGIVGPAINLDIFFYEIILSKGAVDTNYINKISLNVYKDIFSPTGIELDNCHLEKEQGKKFLESLDILYTDLIQIFSYKNKNKLYLISFNSTIINLFITFQFVDCYF